MATPARSATSRMLARLRRRARSSLTARRCPRRSTRAPATAPAPPPRAPRACRRERRPRARRARRRRPRPRRAATCGTRGIGSTPLPGARAARPVLAAGREGGVALPAHGLALDERRPLTGSCPLDALAHRRLDGEDVVPVDDRGRHPEAARPVGDVRRRLALRRRHRDRDAVVLADEDERHLPQHRHVHRLEELALARGAVAEEAEHDLARAAEPARERGPARHRDVRRRRSRSSRRARRRARRGASSRPCPCRRRSHGPSARPSSRRGRRP